MIYKLSKTIAYFFVRQKFISDKQLITYTYCFEIFISTILFWCSIFFLAWYTNLLIPSILYYFTFYCFRTTIGGYHANTHFRCYVLSIATFILFLLFAKFLPNKFYFTLLFFVLSSIIIIRYAPVAHINKPFSQEERLTFRKRSFILLLFFGILICVLTIFHYNLSAFYLTYGITQAAISLFVAYLKK